MLIIKLFNGETLQMFTGNLMGSRRIFLQYLLKRVVRIKKKPYTPQRERLGMLGESCNICRLWGNPIVIKGFSL